MIISIYGKNFSKKWNTVRPSEFHLGGVAGGDFDYWDAGGNHGTHNYEGDGGGKKSEGEGGVNGDCGSGQSVQAGVWAVASD